MLSLETFTPLVGEQFGLRSIEDDASEGHGQGVHPTALVEARALATAGHPVNTQAQARQPFSLIFEGPTEPIFPQRIYRLEHPAMDDALELFLVPVGRSEKNGVRYQAVFT